MAGLAGLLRVLAQLLPRDIPVPTLKGQPVSELLELPQEQHVFLITYVAYRLNEAGERIDSYHAGIALFPNVAYAELAASQVLQQCYPESEGWQHLPLKLDLLPTSALLHLADKLLTGGDANTPDRAS